MLRYLIVLGLSLSTGLFAKVPENSARLIKMGKDIGLQEVNENGEPDHPKFRDKSGLIYFAPKGAYLPNPAVYGDQETNKIPEYFFRTVRDCKTKAILSEQIIFTYNGYQNYAGGSRYDAQCVQDGTEDTFYEETTERLR